jgi:flagellin-like hook-associated protein FlgL
MIDYSTQSAVYQAALRAGSQLIQPSLLDFLR